MLFSGLAISVLSPENIVLHTFMLAYNIANINVILSAKYNHILRGVGTQDNISSHRAYAKNISTSVFVWVYNYITAYDAGNLLIGFAMVYTNERKEKKWNTIEGVQQIMQIKGLYISSFSIFFSKIQMWIKEETYTAGILRYFFFLCCKSLF